MYFGGFVFVHVLLNMVYESIDDTAAFVSLEVTDAIKVCNCCSYFIVIFSESKHVQDSCSTRYFPIVS